MVVDLLTRLRCGGAAKGKSTITPGHDGPPMTLWRLEGELE